MCLPNSLSQITHSKPFEASDVIGQYRRIYICKENFVRVLVKCECGVVTSDSLRARHVEFAHIPVFQKRFINEAKQRRDRAVGFRLMKGNTEIVGCFRFWFVKLGGGNIQYEVLCQFSRPAFHGFDINRKNITLRFNQKIFTPVLTVNGAEGSGRAGEMIAIGKDNLTKASGKTHHACLRKFTFLIVPDIGNMMVPKGVFHQLPGKNLLLVSDADLNIRGMVQNNLLHANLIASKVRINPPKMIENGT